MAGAGRRPCKDRGGPQSELLSEAWVAELNISMCNNDVQCQSAKGPCVCARVCVHVHTHVYNSPHYWVSGLSSDMEEHNASTE